MSSVWLSIDLLRDDNGDTYDPADLPCHLNPMAWDADAPIRIRRGAALECCRCPAMAACAAQGARLGRWRAQGVWSVNGAPRAAKDNATPAEVYAYRHPADRDTDLNLTGWVEEHDPIVRAWAEQTNTELPEPPQAKGA